MKRIDVVEFYMKLGINIFSLNRDLMRGAYEHGYYSSFWIQDPKQRHISKAWVRDRVLHHSIFTVLNPIFEATYIANSFSCREGKGTHKGVRALEIMLRKVSENGLKACYGLKCDVRKFFDSVDHKILKEIISKRIKDEKVLWLVGKVINSYVSSRSNFFEPKGIPIGNLTSQLFANIYLNEFDQFVKHNLKVKHYVRYTDDFVVVSQDREYLESLIKEVSDFLQSELKLEIHPNKVTIRKFSQGVDFLGYIVKPHHILMRTKTKNRMIKKLAINSERYKNGSLSKTIAEQSLKSYLGVMSHADAFELSERIVNNYWL